ncbi:MAG: di-heme-cytochrome C peroxidase, partial [Methylococcaceae bacterium]|nr:di-heme-cytochrome C peroxidase [Methylococcaceae bacterium]
AARKDFYSRDQGSRLMPLRWFTALKQPDGKPFMADSLVRYGYLPNEDAQPSGLPVGFSVDGSGKDLGMTCSACHTRQIEVGGTAYRIDGGPAFADFQSFAADLDSAVNTVLSDPKAFADFARAVLGPAPAAGEQAKLREAVRAWYTPYHTIMDRALPKHKPWGPVRLDAVAMIFNRVSGLDIGPPPSYMIPENIQVADAPVRYPFIWNAPIQDKTQWPGFADNGDKILALSRNSGEVYGVFAVFHPRKNEGKLLGFDFLADNSANFQGLEALEELVLKIGPPKWPWAVDQSLADAGREIYDRKTGQGGCIECHGIRRGQPRLLNKNTWATPVQDVGTDSREYNILGWRVKSGVLEGAYIPILSQEPLKSMDLAVNVLQTAVMGTLLQHLSADLLSAKAEAKLEFKARILRRLLGPTIDQLKGAFRKPEVSGKPSFAYESRVMEGIWAAAPYLHNGSVPSLAELLKPAAERVTSFKVGPAYDSVNVGLAAEQTRFDYTYRTTDCSAGDSGRNSGNSRCGHEFGTRLSADEKKALLEYLKVL